jgi:integrase
MEQKGKSGFYPYKEARLVHYSYSAEKLWYIDFSAWDLKSGMLKRRRIREFNKIENLKQRRTYAENLVAEINQVLASGACFDVDKAKKEKHFQSNTTSKTFYTIAEALDLAFNAKKPDLSERSISCYKSDLKKYITYLTKFGSPNENILAVDEVQALGFADYLIQVDGLQNKSVNLRIGALKSIFEVLVERKIIPMNPFRCIKKRKVVSTSQNIAYTDKEIAKIREYLLKNNTDLWYFCNFVFYTFLRPEEIRRLKVKNINMKKRQIYISAYDSKVKREGYVEIPAGLVDIIEAMNIDWKDKERYVFNSPDNGPYKISSRNHQAMAYREVMNELKMDSNHTIYSWKHTGNVKAYLAGIGLYSIMAQNRHSSLETTKNYLKSLGLLENREFSEKFSKIRI